MNAADYNEAEIRAGRLTAAHMLTILNEARSPFESDVKTFQRLRGLLDDGKAGPDTRREAEGRPPNQPPLTGPVYQPILGGCHWSGNLFVPGEHDGRDGFRYPKGPEGWPDSGNATVIAIAAGEVTRIGWQSNGLWIRIDHGNGIESLSGHVNGAGLVTVGQVIPAGTHLGPLWARINPPHIHHEIEIDGVLVEPVEFLAAAGAVVLA
jgi:hypothetical protein